MFIETYYDDRAVATSTSEPVIPYPELSGEELTVWQKYLPTHARAGKKEIVGGEMPPRVDFASGERSLPCRRHVRRNIPRRIEVRLSPLLLLLDDHSLRSRQDRSEVISYVR